MPEPSKPVKSLDLTLLRGFAIAAVVFLHVAGNYRNGTPGFLSSVLAALCVFFRYGVPLFLYISGRLLAQRYRWPFEVPAFYARRLQVILAPYLVFSFAYLALYALQGRRVDWGDWAVRIATGKAAEHLWFFLLIFELYLLYPLLARFAVRKTSTVFWSGVWAAVWAFQAIAHLQLLPFSADFWAFARFAIYFVTGIAAVSNPDGLFDRLWNRKASASEVFGLAVLILGLTAIQAAVLLKQTVPAPGQWWDLNHPSYVRITAACEPFLFLASIRLFAAWAKALEAHPGFWTGRLAKFGEDAFGIYLVHLIFLAAAVRAAKPLGLGAGDFLFYPFVLALTIAPSILFVRLVRRIPRLRWILGE